MRPQLELGRRELILGAAGLLVPATALAAAPGKLAFAVFRNGTKVGEHHVTIAANGADLTATTNVAMTVKIGPVPVFKYKHAAVERWRGTQFLGIETTTTENGKVKKVVATPGAGAVTIQGPAGLVRGPADAAPLSHWNTASFSRPMFNQQEGKMLKVRATRMSPTHWQVRGEAEIDDFYDAQGQWSGLKGKLEDGSTMEYKRI